MDAFFKPKSATLPVKTIGIPPPTTPNQTNNTRNTIESDQFHYSSSMYKLYQEQSGGSAGNEDDAMKYLVAAVQAEKPDPRALYEAGTNVLYAKLYSEYGKETDILSPEQCLMLAVDADYMDAKFQLTLLRADAMDAKLQLTLTEYARASSLEEKTAAFDEIERMALAGNPKAASEFFRINYRKGGTFKWSLFHVACKRDNKILDSLHKSCDREIYYEKTLELSNLYASMVATSFPLLVEIIKDPYYEYSFSSYGEQTHGSNSSLYLKDAYLVDSIMSESKRLLKNLLTLGFVKAICEEVHKTDGSSDVSEYVEEAHKNGHPDAGIIIGDLLRKKEYVPKEYVVKCYEIAIKYGNKEAVFKLGEWYLTRTTFWTTKEEFAAATKLCQHVQNVPDNYPKLQKLFSKIQSVAVNATFSIQ